MTDQRSQPEAQQVDPSGLWRQYYEANEQIWTKAMKETMTTPGYAEAQGKMIETFLAYQKMLRDSTSTQLGTLNLPTRDDLARLGEIVVGLEEKIDQLDDRSDERLGGLEEMVEQLERKVTGLGDQIARLVELVAQPQDRQDRDGDVDDDANGHQSGRRVVVPTKAAD